MGRSLNFELPISVPENMPHLGTAKVWLHISQVITTFMTICMVAPIISTESRFYGGSQPGPNYTLFVAIISIAIPIILIYFPWMYDRKNKFKKLGKFCLKPRTNMIFTSFYSVLWGTAGIAITVHANNPDHCNFDGEMQENYGNDYTSAWTTQCNLAKAAAGFTWITCLLWVATLICTLIIFWNEKQLIQKNLRTHEMNKQAALGMANDVENGQYQTAHPGYYEEDDAHVNVRPQSLDQARPLNNVSPPPMHEASPFESPYDPPVQPAYYQEPAGLPHHAVTPMPEQIDYAYDEYRHQAHTPEPPMVTSNPHENTYTPMPMPEPSHYSPQPAHRPF